MKARLVHFTAAEGRQKLTLEFARGRRNDFKEKYDLLRDEDVQVQIKKFPDLRSLDANAYFWVLADKVAEATGEMKEDVYRHLVKEIGGVSHVVCIQTKALKFFRADWERKGLGWQTEAFESQIEGCTNVIAYKGSSAYNTKQMSALIDSVIQECEVLGIETLPPAEVARLKSQWKPEK